VLCIIYQDRTSVRYKVSDSRYHEAWISDREKYGSVYRYALGPSSRHFSSRPTVIIGSDPVHLNGYTLRSIKVDCMPQHASLMLRNDNGSVSYDSAWPKVLLDKLTTVSMGEISNFEYGRLPKIVEKRKDGNSTKFTKLFKSSECAIDAIAPFSIIDPDEKTDLAQHFLESAPEQLSVISFKSLFRGGNGDGLCGTGDGFRVVSKQVALESECIFAYQAYFNVFNRETQVWNSLPIVCLGMFVKPEKIVKYKRAISFLTEFRSLMLNEPQRYIDYDKYQEEILQKTARLHAYWKGLPDTALKILSNSTSLSRITTSPQEVKGLDTETMTPFVRSIAINSLPAKVELKVLQNKKEEITETTEITEELIEDCKIGIEANSLRIERLQIEIKDLQDRCTKKDRKLQGLKAALLDIGPLVTRAQEKFEKDIDEDQIQAMTNTILSSIEERLHVKIQEMEIQQGHTNVKLGLGTTADIDYAKDFSLKFLQFTTLKPSMIHVDRFENAGKEDIRVGGPYVVTIDGNGLLYIQLLSLASVFGLSGNLSCIHPHTSSLSIDMTKAGGLEVLLSTKRKACLGDAAPAIYKAMQNGDIRTVILNALNWVENAYSTDGWGCQYEYFPKLEEVNMDPDWDNIQTPEPNELSSQEGIDSLIEAAREELDI
jgi:hypothetical protein